MRKIFVIFLLAMLIIPGAAASSTITGWIAFSEPIGWGKGEVTIDDISMTDYSLLLHLGNGSKRERVVVPYEGNVSWGDYFLKVHSAVYSDSESYANVTYTFPYLLLGERVRIGGYEVYLKSVNEESGVLIISNRTGFKNLTIKAGETAEFKNMRISLTPMPLLFRGYLKKGSPKKVERWNLEFVNFSVIAEGGELKEEITLRVNGANYKVEPGDKLVTENLAIDVEDLIGSDHLKVTVKLRGAYIDVKMLPDFEGWIQEGKTTMIGPYLVRIETVAKGYAVVSIMNTCGRVLKRTSMSIGPVSAGIYYNGMLLGALSTRENGGVKEVYAVAFLDENRLPKPEKIALLNITMEAPQRITQLVPFEVTVKLKNEGSGDLKYLEVIPEFSNYFEIQGEYQRYVEELREGESIELKFTLLPKKSGKLNLGHVTVIGHAPYLLSCDGLEPLEFSSEIRNIDVEPVQIDYQVEVRAQNGSVGSLIPLNLSVRNTGTAELPFKVTIALPNGFGVVAENFTTHGKWITKTDRIPPNSSREYSILIIPTSPGKYEVSAAVETYGKVFTGSAVIEVTGTTPSLQPSNYTTNSTCNETVKTVLVKVPVPCNQTNTTSQAPENPGLLQRIIDFLIPFLAGVGFILLLAWIAARLEGS